MDLQLLTGEFFPEPAYPGWSWMLFFSMVIPRASMAEASVLKIGYSGHSIVQVRDGMCQ